MKSLKQAQQKEKYNTDAKRDNIFFKISKENTFLDERLLIEQDMHHSWVK
jgi:hypothetical protein